MTEAIRKAVAMQTLYGCPVVIVDAGTVVEVVDLDPLIVTDDNIVVKSRDLYMTRTLYEKIKEKSLTDSAPGGIR